MKHTRTSPQILCPENYGNGIEPVYLWFYQLAPTFVVLYPSYRMGFCDAVEEAIDCGADAPLTNLHDYAAEILDDYDGNEEEALNALIEGAILLNGSLETAIDFDEVGEWHPTAEELEQINKQAQEAAAAYEAEEA